MSEIHVRQIKAHLDSKYSPHIDISDLATQPQEIKVSSLLSRSLAAMALVMLTGISEKDAAATITDGFGDNGIDAAYFHPADRTIYIVQAKWHGGSGGAIDQGELLKFLAGFRDFIQGNWTKFNKKLSSRASEFDAHLLDASTSLCLVTIYTGQQGLAPQQQTSVDEELDRINDAGELASLQLLKQQNIYSFIRQGAEGAATDCEVALLEWGQIKTPYQAYYGQVAATDLAKLYDTFGPRLLAPNIRLFLGSTEANGGIVDTLTSSPAQFWYFNNGVTALCRSIKKKPIGGDKRDMGVFDCHDLRIVNGAQTVGSVHKAAQKSRETLITAMVPIRIISLESTPEDFDRLVTKFNNTQNRIDRRDFVSLDQEQDRLQAELKLDGVFYSFKSGESNLAPSGAFAFDFEEAAIARACALGDIGMAVQAKREISKLWDDIEKPPYKLLFNAQVSGVRVVRQVDILRQIELVLQDYRSASDKDERNLAYHGNRFVETIIFKKLTSSITNGSGRLSAADVQLTQDASKKAFGDVLESVRELFPGAYMASLFKNGEKCAELEAKV